MNQLCGETQEISSQGHQYAEGVKPRFQRGRERSSTPNAISKLALGERIRRCLPLYGGDRTFRTPTALFKAETAASMLLIFLLCFFENKGENCPVIASAEGRLQSLPKIDGHTATSFPGQEAMNLLEAVSHGDLEALESLLSGDHCTFRPRPTPTFLNR